jgi:hypothetical protein
MHLSRVVIKASAKTTVVVLIAEGQEDTIYRIPTILAVVDSLVERWVTDCLTQPQQEVLWDSIGQSVLGGYNEGELDALKASCFRPIRGFRNRSRLFYRELRESSWLHGLAGALDEAALDHVAVAIVRMMGAGYAAAYGRQQTTQPLLVMAGDVMISDTVA